MINSFIIYSIISFIVLASISVISYKLNLVDIPNKRKKHSKPTAYTGGIAISIIYVFSIVFFDFNDEKLNLILSISFLFSLVGFIDDKYNLNIGGKLSLQIIPLIYLIIIENLRLIEIGDYEFFRLTLSSFSIPFTLLSALFLINAFNYFDGIDGLLGSVSISVIFILFFLTPDQEIKLFLISVFIPIFIFLLFNFSFFKLPKLFLGDSGSLLLGMVLGFIIIYFALNNIAHPIVLAWSISIFVYEFLSINLIRIIKNRNIFKAGFDHVHHLIFDRCKSLFITNVLMFFSNIIFFLAGYFCFKSINPLASFVLFITFFIIFFIIRLKYYSK